MRTSIPAAYSAADYQKCAGRKLKSPLDTLLVTKRSTNEKITPLTSHVMVACGCQLVLEPRDDADDAGPDAGAGRRPR